MTPLPLPLSESLTPSFIPFAAMERSFRLIDLPSVPLRRVFHQMEIPQLYSLSVLRRELAQVMASLRVETTIYVVLQKGRSTIVLTKDWEVQLHWELVLDGAKSSLKDCVPHRTTTFPLGQKSQFLRKARNIMAKLIEMFYCPELRLTLDMDVFYLFESIFSEDDFDRCSHFHMTAGSCNTEQMDRLRRTLKTVDSFYSTTFIETDVESRKWLVNSPDLDIDEPDGYPKRRGWFTSEDLMNITNSDAHIESHKLTENDVNQFIAKWIDSKSPQMIFMRIEFEGTVREEEVLQHLHMTPCSPNSIQSLQTYAYHGDLLEISHIYECNTGIASFFFYDEVLEFRLLPVDQLEL